MSKPFLGIGVGFPVGLDQAGALTQAAYEESVRQSIWIILSTTKGERVMRPDFGCGLSDLVFEPNTAATAGRVAHAVEDALQRFEPRIDLLGVDVRADGSGRLLIDIGYQMRTTNNIFNLVYPFYLEKGANQ